LQIEIFYNQRGGESEKSIATDEVGNEIGVFFNVRTMNYLEIPLTLKANLGQGKFDPFVLCGPSFGILLSAHDEYDTEFNPDFKTNYNIKDDLETFEYGLVFGAGCGYQLSEKVLLNLEGRYYVGLKNQLKDGKYATQKSRDIIILVGVSFNI
jgi:hypothetical protein